MPSSLARLIAPRSIAFIGGQEAETALRVTKQLGYPGTVYAVNPHREALDGVPCRSSVADLPEAPDAAFVAVRREAAVAAVRDLAAHGTGGAVIYASGFAEHGPRGRALQEELVAAAGGMAIMGPNCYGFINALERISPWADEHGLTPCQRGVAIVTQSGNMAVNFAMMRRTVPVAGLYTLGNQAGIDLAAMLDALADDDRVTAVGLHIEGLKDVPAFSAAATKALSRRKPVVALKTGGSAQGAKVAMSHTSSLAGSDALHDALFERTGIARVGSVSALAETLKLLHHGGPLTGNRIVSMSCSGGEAALVADMAAGRTIVFPEFDAGTRQRVAASLNDYVVIDNPLDYHTFIWNQGDKLTATFSAVLAGGFDCAMLVLDIPTRPPMDPAAWIVTAEAYARAAAATGARSVTVSTLHESMPEAVAERLSAAGVAPLLGLDDAFNAFEAANAVGAAWARPELPHPIVKGEPVDGPVGALSEYDTKQRLAGYGLAVPHGAVCAPADAPATARRLGFPVALKVSGTTQYHKSDAGGVQLNLTGEAAVAAAAERMAVLADELLVERMVEGCVAELIIGVNADPQFGLGLVIGAGGVLAELLRDTVTLLLPAEPGAIESALSRLQVTNLVDGFRGRRGDREAVIAAVEAVARFALDHASSLEELEVNPLMVLAPGKGAVAADALIRLRNPDQAE